MVFQENVHIAVTLHVQDNETGDNLHLDISLGHGNHGNALEQRVTLVQYSAGKGETRCVFIKQHA